VVALTAVVQCHLADGAQHSVLHVRCRMVDYAALLNLDIMPAAHRVVLVILHRLWPCGY